MIGQTAPETNFLTEAPTAGIGLPLQPLPMYEEISGACDRFLDDRPNAYYNRLLPPSAAAHPVIPKPPDLKTSKADDYGHYVNL